VTGGRTELFWTPVKARAFSQALVMGLKLKALRPVCKEARLATSLRHCTKQFIRCRISVLSSSAERWFIRATPNW